MVVVFHDRRIVTKIYDFDKKKDLLIHEENIQKTLFQLALKDNKTLLWCHKDLERFINHQLVTEVFKHDLIMASYATSKQYVIPKGIGYADIASTGMKVKFDVTYPTWLMSSDIGGIHSKVLIRFPNLINKRIGFDLFLNYISKSGSNKGLLCYSDPRLLLNNFKGLTDPYEQINLFVFVKDHFKKRWLTMVFLDYWLYEKKIKIWSYLKSFFSFSHRKDDIDFRDLTIKSVLGKNDVDKDYDVLIPTLGRATYLEDVLHDLANQSTLPAKVILIEQNADINASTELNYIYDKDWPFEIDHMLINRLGACNARNIALSKVSSSWVFFADDDIRITTDLVEKAFEFIYQYGVSAVTLASLMEGESLIQKIPIQWHTFSTNSSFVNSNALQGITFGLEHEFGFGEDSDFGMKLRNKGHDVIFYPSTDILHLKAPIGGFRSKVLHPWNNDEISPKPSPMVMAHKLKHVTKEQLLGYRTTMFIKNYRLSEKINPFSYYSIMAKKWDKSILWAQELIRKHNPNGI